MKKSFKKALKLKFTKAGEAYIDSIVKIIICVVIGALLLGAIFTVASGAMNQATNHVNLMLNGDISQPTSGENNEYFTITYLLTGCAVSNASNVILENSDYVSQIIPDEGFSFFSDVSYLEKVPTDKMCVSITMNGMDITESAFSSPGIEITNVSGDIVITASCCQRTNDMTAVVSGTWQFCETVYMESYYSIEQDIAFLSNNNSFTKLSTDATTSVSHLYYDDTEVMLGATYGVFYSDSWEDAAYRTVSFGNEPQEMNLDFYNWFLYNATKISN